MKTIGSCALACFLGFAGPAFSATLVATRAGLMCSSPDALSKLTLPDGSSRTSSANARQEDFAAKQSGGCVDFVPGTQVTVIKARKNTSVVAYDIKDGRGTREFMVPNIDFTTAGDSARATTRRAPAWGDNDYPPLLAMNTLLAAVTKQCPRQGWTGRILSHTETGPWYDAVKLTPAQNAAIEKEMEQCDAGLACPTYIRLGMEVQMGYLPQLVQAICSQKAAAN